MFLIKIKIFTVESTKIPKPFECCSNPVNQERQKRLFRDTRIIPILKDEKSIEIFFKQIITISIFDKIAKYSNKKIKLIHNQVIENANYRLAREKLTSLEVSSEEIYGFHWYSYIVRNN